MKKLKVFFETKQGRSLLAVSVAVLLLAANLLLLLGVTNAAFYPDATPEQLYTITPILHQVCEQLGGDVTITFCDDPDRLLANTSTRYVYILAQQLANRHEQIELVTVNIEKNPTAVYPYRPTSAAKIKADDVIISCGGRYRVYAADSFWTIAEDGDTERYWSFNGEYKLATAMLSVTAITQPVVYFTYGHGESFYVSPEDTENSHLLAQSNEDMKPFYDLLLGEGLKVDYLSYEGDTLSAIPEDCALLIMNNPQQDCIDPDIYAYEDNCAIDVIHRYLAERSGAFMMFLDPNLDLPNLEDLMSHWGILYEGVLVKDNTSPTGNKDVLSGLLNGDENEMSYGVYKDVVSLATPPRLVMPHSGSVKSSWITHEGATSSTANVTAYYSAFLQSSENAFAYFPNQELAEENPRVFDLCALTTRIRTDTITTDSYFSYVFGSACPEMISGEYLSNAAYGNYDVMFALVRYISRTDVYASMDLGGVSFNSSNMGGKPVEYGDLSSTPVNVYQNGKVVFTYAGLTPSKQVTITVLVIGLPVLTAFAVGVAICLRRRR